MILQLEGHLNSLLDNWPVWKKRIIEYAKLEGRNRDSVKQLLRSLELEDMDEREGTVYPKSIYAPLILISYIDC